MFVIAIAVFSATRGAGAQAVNSTPTYPLIKLIWQTCSQMVSYSHNQRTRSNAIIQHLRLSRRVFGALSTPEGETTWLFFYQALPFIHQLTSSFALLAVWSRGGVQWVIREKTAEAKKNQSWKTLRPRLSKGRCAETMMRSPACASWLVLTSHSSTGSRECISSSLSLIQDKKSPQLRFIVVVSC